MIIYIILRFVNLKLRSRYKYYHKFNSLVLAKKITILDKMNFSFIKILNFFKITAKLIISNKQLNNLRVVTFFTSLIFGNALGAAPAKYNQERHRGIYSYISSSRIDDSNPRVKEIQASIDNSSVNGASIMERWDMLEPVEGQFDWPKLDRWITYIVQKRKKIAIGVAGGGLSPDWLRSKGIPHMHLSWDKTHGRGKGGINDCLSKYFPYVWHPGYVIAYNKMITALKNHLTTLVIPGFPPGSALEAVTIVKLSGINVTTNEIQLPITHGYELSKCKSNNDLKFRNAGYTESKVLNAWTNIAMHISKTFTNRVLSIDVISNGAFPFKGADGKFSRIINGYDTLTRSIVNTGLNKFGSRLMVQWSALSTFPMPILDMTIDLVKSGKSKGRVAWQLNQRGGLGSGCGRNFAPCDEAWINKIIKDGFSKYQADYLEVHSYDASRFNLRR